MEKPLNCEEHKKLSLDEDVEALATSAIKSAINVHRKPGPGLIESVYQQCLAYELNRSGLAVQTEVPISIHYHDLQFESAYRADLVLNRKLIIELKSVESILPIHKTQVITYLKLAQVPLGLLINFNVSLLKDGLHRIIHPSLLTNSSLHSS